MATARQESAWNPEVKSSIGTSGLMQITPDTTTHTVKMLSIPGYSSPGQLLDLETNTNIGTSYLQCIYQQFGSNRIFSSATYSAKPEWVRTWLGNNAGRIGAVAFIKSVSFSKTHNYVKNVLAYNAYYCYFTGDKPMLMSAAGGGRRYGSARLGYAIVLFNEYNQGGHSTSPASSGDVLWSSNRPIQQRG